MEQGYYSMIATPREAIYEEACALDNQDVPLEDWPVNGDCCQHGYGSDMQQRLREEHEAEMRRDAFGEV